MRRLHILAPAALMAPFSAATAAPLVVQVLGEDGRPVSGAVVTVAVPGTPAPVPHGPYVMAQRNVAFEPHVLIVPVGATVTFPNFDRVRHHVYSFSTARRFELKLFGREGSRTVVFDKPGAVALGCNIHDAMSGVIFVAATPYAAVTGADGRARLNLARAGGGTLSVWHPSVRATGNAQALPVTVPAAGAAVSVRLRR